MSDYYDKFLSTVLTMGCLYLIHIVSKDIKNKNKDIIYLMDNIDDQDNPVNSNDQNVDTNNTNDTNDTNDTNE